MHFVPAKAQLKYAKEVDTKNSKYFINSFSYKEKNGETKPIKKAIATTMNSSHRAMYFLNR